MRRNTTHNPPDRQSRSGQTFRPCLLVAAGPPHCALVRSGAEGWPGLAWAGGSTFTAVMPCQPHLLACLLTCQHACQPACLPTCMHARLCLTLPNQPLPCLVAASLARRHPPAAPPCSRRQPPCLPVTLAYQPVVGPCSQPANQPANQASPPAHRRRHAAPAHRHRRQPPCMMPCTATACASPHPYVTVATTLPSHPGRQTVKGKGAARAGGSRER